MAMHKNHKKGGGREQARDAEDKQRHDILEQLVLTPSSVILLEREDIIIISNLESKSVY